MNVGIKRLNILANSVLLQEIKCDKFNEKQKELLKKFNDIIIKAVNDCKKNKEELFSSFIFGSLFCFVLFF
jgi:hypothetical protein